MRKKREEYQEHSRWKLIKKYHFYSQVEVKHHLSEYLKIFFIFLSDMMLSKGLVKVLSEY